MRAAAVAVTVTSSCRVYVNVDGRLMCVLSFSPPVFSAHTWLSDLVQVTKDFRLARVSGPLTYNDIAAASSEGRRDIWTDRERGWDEAEAIDTGQNRPLYHC